MTCSTVRTVVTTTQCFDDLNIPPEHPGRSKSDTYYLTDTELLRTTRRRHQSQHLRQGHEAFLCTGDVYRRDEITVALPRSTRWRANYLVRKMNGQTDGQGGPGRVAGMRYCYEGPEGDASLIKR